MINNDDYISSDATNVNDMFTSGRSLYGNIDTLAVHFGEYFFLKKMT